MRTRSSPPEPGYPRGHALTIRLPLRAELGGQRLLLAPGADHEKQKIHGEKRKRPGSINQHSSESSNHQPQVHRVAYKGERALCDESLIGI